MVATMQLRPYPRLLAVAVAIAAVWVAVPTTALAAAHRSAAADAKTALHHSIRGFPLFFSRVSCHGTKSRQTCNVKFSFSNDTATGTVTLKLTPVVAAGIPKLRVSYVSRLKISNPMGGGTARRTFRGRWLTNRF